MSRPDEAIQRASFNGLVDTGVYSTEFDHPQALKEFVAKVVADYVSSKALERPLRVLDCGCGTGAWLAYLGALLEAVGTSGDFYGFDLSDGMVDLARGKLADQIEPAHIQRGDLLDATAYRFNGIPGGFDLIFVFDAIQQLPPGRQFDACELMVQRLAPGGTLLVFDHDKASPYGREMARKKFITRYLYIPLVPRYYCNAKYPPLGQFAERLAQWPGVSARVVAADNSPKMALVVKREDEG